jgi:hypothetical protein
VSRSSTPLSRDARRTQREHGRICQRYRLQRHLESVSQADARRRSYGNLVVSLFVVLAVLMAGYTMHVDRQQQQQQLERLR